MAHQDDGAAAGGDMLGQIGLQEGQRSLGIVPDGRITDARPLPIRRIEIQLHEVDIVPVPGVV